LLNLKDLSFRTKFLFFGVFVFVPWIANFVYFYHRHWPRYLSLRAEIREVEHFPLYLRLLNLVQRHRSLVYWYYRSDPSSEKARALKSEILREESELLAFIHDETVLARLSHGPFERNFFTQLEKRFSALRLANFTGSPEKAFMAHSTLIVTILNFMRTEGERYQLFYDPDLRIRGLSELLLLRIPYFVETVEQLAGVTVASAPEFTEQEREEIFDLYAKVLGAQALINWSLTTLPVSSLSGMQHTTAEKLLTDFLKEIEFFLKRSSPREAEIFSSGKLVVTSELISEAYYALFQQLVTDLKTLLRDREKDLLVTWGWQTGLALFFSLVFAFLFFLFYRELAGKLALVHEGARRMASGDLSHPIAVDSRDEIGEIARVLNQSMERIRAQIKEIYRLYYHDSLTGLPNRAMLMKDIPSYPHPILFLLDLQSFRDINLVYGTDRGDQVLRLVGKHLQRELSYPLYRMEADEFMVLGDWGGRPEKARSFFEEVREAVEKLEKNPLLIPEEIFVDFRGVAVYGESPRPQLVIYAYEVLREKASSIEKFYLVPFSEKEDRVHEENLFWLRITREALKENRLHPFYQPICSLRDGHLHKFEALVRIVLRDGTVISPIKFLGLAQKVGLYPQITQRVIEEAVRDFAKLPVGVSINLSFQDFLLLDLKSYLLKTLEKYDLDPRRLTIEVVETEEISNWEKISHFLRELKREGITLAIDDFGTGYSNLHRLIELEVDYLKIDGSLIKRLGTDEKSRLLVAAILDFAKKAGIHTVAEFVSDERILKLVREMGIEYGQGYYFAPPQPIGEVRKKWFSS